jgi:hypothetical protein
MPTHRKHVHRATERVLWISIHPEDEEVANMGEASGTIRFINSHDYVSDITGENWVGCLASLRLSEGEEISLYTESLRLQQTLEMTYATGRTVTVSYWDQTPGTIGEREPVAHAIATRRAARGPFLVKAIWTLE